MRQPDIVSERRLKALREEAARTGEVKGGGVVPSGAPFPRPNTPGYYGIPLLTRISVFSVNYQFDKMRQTR
jgi:hypothetical protein